MSFAATFRKSAFALAGFASVLAYSTAPTPAYAIPVKGADGHVTCMPAAQMTEALKAEGQKSVIVGNRFGSVFGANGNEIAALAITNVFTVNEDGEGYRLEGNRPLGTPSTEFCVVAKYTNARFNNWERAGIPAFAQFNVPAKAEVQRICTAANAQNGLACGDMASALTNGAAANSPQRVMMVAQTVNDKGQPGKQLVVTGRPQDGGGATYVADSRGIGTELFIAEKMAFTPVGKAIINAPVRTAALDR